MSTDTVMGAAQAAQPAPAYGPSGYSSVHESPSSALAGLVPTARIAALERSATARSRNRMPAFYVPEDAEPERIRPPEC